VKRAPEADDEGAGAQGQERTFTMANRSNRANDYDYRRLSRWQEADEARGEERYGRGRRIWDQESGMYNQSPGYGRSTPAGRYGSEFSGGSSYGGWGRGGYGEYDKGTFGRGDVERGEWRRGGYPSGSRSGEGSYYGPDRFDEETYFGGGYGAGGRFADDVYGGRGYGDEGWFHEDTGAGLGSTGRSITGGRFGAGGFGGGYGRMGAEAWQGPYAGRGPRGYKRSDDRIRDDVSEELERHGWIDASDIEVTVQDGEVTLTGSVESRSQKRMAEDAAERVTGVKDVHNQLRVHAPTASDRERERGAAGSAGQRTTGSGMATETSGNRHAAAAQR
jgi:hypothetical protein